MAKRKSMDDVLAGMSAMVARPVPEPATVEATVREAPAVEPEPVVETAPEVSAPITQAKDDEPVEVSVHRRDTRARAHVRKEEIARQTKPVSVPRGYTVRPPRIEKPHQSIYADPAVWKVIRQIALAEDVKPQDLYREALRLMLRKRGYDFDRLDRGED